jgi:hypothetical protein
MTQHTVQYIKQKVIDKVIICRKTVELTVNFVFMANIVRLRGAPDATNRCSWRQFAGAIFKLQQCENQQERERDEAQTLASRGLLAVIVNKGGDNYLNGKAWIKKGQKLSHKGLD